MSFLPDSIAADDSVVATGPLGQRAHRELIAHTERFQRKLWEVRPGVWTLVGNGLSNQTFVEGPNGLIVIDTGESVEEMTAALAEVRQVTAAPVAAVIYTHFHYVGGTEAVMAAEAGNRAAADDAHPITVYGHHKIVSNRHRVGVELSAAGGRGLVHQFGIQLPADGPDGLVNVGLGREFRHSEHAPFTEGFVAPTNLIWDDSTETIAGLTVQFALAPSDADDSLTIWFPELSTCVNNLFWPAVFNVFAIRGEEYRDPRILLTGLDHIVGLSPEHLVGAHGPPLSGVERIGHEVSVYRDSIQFLWDQTVRGINRGLTADELVEFVQLPDDYGQSFRTKQLYGLVEHHVRQIHAGLRGWFDGDEAKLVPLARADRYQRLIDGFGGPDAVRVQVADALANDDVRWAIEMATWLVYCPGSSRTGDHDDRGLLAAGLRMAARRTTSANVRNWCLTRALELEETIDLTRFRVHRFGYRPVLHSPVDVYINALRLVLDPAAARGIDARIGFVIGGQEAPIGLHVRRGVAVPINPPAVNPADEGRPDHRATTDGVLTITHQAWAAALSGRTPLADAIAAGDATIDGDVALMRRTLACFDLPGLG